MYLTVHILLANKYFFIKGGAENSFFQTARLLENRGHTVSFFSMQNRNNLPTKYARYFVSNVDYDTPNLRTKIKAAARLHYSWEARYNIERLLQNHKPDLAHLNNIYHQISPSIIHSLRNHGIPMVMSLRDFKLVCPSYSMLANGKICEACKGKRYYQCFLNACVKDSRTKSLLNVTEMYLHHKILHIYDRIDIFIAPSLFLKKKIEDMGFKGVVMYLPNFINIQEYTPQYDWTERSIVYFGRLSHEKGLLTLIEAMKGLQDITLKIIGEGPQKKELCKKIERLGLYNIIMLGYLGGEYFKEEIRKSMFVVLPSECYENNPRSIIEGFALGKPAVGSRIGGIPELIKDGKTGLTFKMGDINELRSKIIYLTQNPAMISAMGKASRWFVENELTADKHYHKLMQIYEMAISRYN